MRSEPIRTLFVTAGPPLPADRGARVRDHALLMRVAAQRPASLLAVIGPRDRPEALAPLRGELASLHTTVVEQRLRVPARLRPGGPRLPLSCAPFSSPGAVSALSELIERERPDLLQLEHWFLSPLIEALPEASRPVTVASLHNVASEQYRGMARDARPPSAAGYRAKAALARRVERRLTRFDAVICVSELDRVRLAAVAPGSRAAVVPNGVDCRALRPLPDDGEPGALLLVANLDYRPNLEAAEWLCRAVLPPLAGTHPRARVRLVGPGGGARAAALGRLPRVEHVGPVEDTVPHYRAAQVAVVPLHAGGGTRLKVLEAMALGRPVVSTSIGCEGLGLIGGEHLLVADDPAGFAASIGRLLDSLAKRSALATAARSMVERDYDWDRCATALMAVHDEAVARADQCRKRRAATA